MIGTEDRYIIQKCLDGETEAFGFLVDRYRESVYALAYSKLRNSHDSEDITQEVFIRAYQKLRTLKQWDNMHAWLYSITNNMCKDWIKIQSKRPDRISIEDQDPQKIENLAANSQDDPMIEALNEALESLPEMYRQVITLYYLGGKDNKEIANFLGISPDSVRQRLTRARSLLREEINAMMGRAFETQRLPAGFTFRIIEAVKHVRINPVSTSNGVPWGLSLAAGLLCLALGLNSQFTNMFQVADLNPTIAGESSVAETGDFQIDIVEISDDPLLQNAFFMAPQGEGGTWARKEDMPNALWGSSASAVNGKIYVIGGGLDNNVPTNSVVEYDPATGKWTKKADMPTARGLLSTAVMNGKIYAIGGARFWEAVPDVGLSTIEEYDPVADKWTEKADMPTARYVHTSSVVDGKIYVIGGATVFSFVSAVEEYDPATDTWTKKANMPTATMLHSASVLNGKIYIMGGQIPLPLPPSTIANSKVEEYDPVTDTWTEKADMSTARCLLASSVANGKIYAIGGYKDVWMGNPISLVEEYDPLTDTWTRKPDMPTSRYLIASSVVNGKIYTFGGTDTWLGWNAFGKPLSTVEEYTPEGWQSVSPVSPQGKKQNTWGGTKTY